MKFHEQIVSKENNDYLQGIADKYGEKEKKANSIGKQIFNLYDYKPIQIANYVDELYLKEDLDDLNKNYTNNELNEFLKEKYNHNSLYWFLMDDSSYWYEPERTDHGIDHVIYKDEIPQKDPLNLKHIRNGRFDDTCYTIDYKSNNFSYDVNSVYVKLMPYHGSKSYIVDERSGKIIDPIERHYQQDQKSWKRARKKGKNKINSLMEKYHDNKQLLGSQNRTDYFLYIKFDKIENNIEPEYGLIHAYLVPAESLRVQVVNVLNGILEKGGYSNLIKFNDSNKDLNSKMVRAFLMVKDKPMPPKSEIELFVPNYKKDLILRIPEKLLTSHIKFDRSGNII